MAPAPVIASVEDVVFHASTALRIPVLVLALAALALVLYELGALAVELRRRRGREPHAVEAAATAAGQALAAGDVYRATAALRGVAASDAMRAAVDRLLAQLGAHGLANRLAKVLADFDLGSLRRLERTRMLVRGGPALGLMGTLIPLAPALTGLAKGDVGALTRNLQVAFSVTVLGLLVGAVAFAISLVRDRLYAQDLSDLEFIAATVEQSQEPVEAAA